jgi:Aspartyl protease
MHVLALILSVAVNSSNATIPFTYFDNRMMIECTIDGKGPFDMIVDTGDPAVTITPETASRIAANVHDAGVATGAGTHAVKSGGTILQTLSISSLTFANVSAEVIDLSQIRSKFHFPHLDGVIGYPILKQFDTFVNVDAGTLSFMGVLPALPSNATTTSFEGVLPVIHAEIDGIPTVVIVDTGDRSSLTLFGPFARQHAFYGRYPSKNNVITGYGLGGPIYADVFTLPRLDVLGTHLTSIITRASRQTGGSFASSEEGGSVGAGVLKRFNIIYDYPHHAIIAWPSKYFTQPDVFVQPG